MTLTTENIETINIFINTITRKLDQDTRLLTNSNRVCFEFFLSAKQINY